jgi:anti-sigma regulatory factor (Ser/Thr protein kinase)
MLVPVSLTSGDLLLAAYRPDGVQHILIGDFTGHGLAAAMGAIPVADTFQSMTHKGFAIDQIAAEMNRKLKASLPVGLFLAACLLSLDTRAGRICIWNGGVPEVLVKRPGEGLCTRLPSRHLPLGILEDEHFDPELDCAGVRIGDYIYAYSDGLIETENPEGELFGEQRLARLLSSPDAGGGFRRIQDALEEFRRGQPQRDDITLIEIESVAPVETAAPETPECVLADTDGALRLRVDFGVERLRVCSAQPELARMLDLFPGLGAHRSSLYTVLAELFNNALEHGLLELDSSMKQDSGGFDEYYRQREQRLRNLEQGSIRVELELSGDSNRGTMRIEVEDSGRGFDHAAYAAAGPCRSLARRGLLLVESLCHDMVIHEPGNRIEALYVWSGNRDEQS